MVKKNDCIINDACKHSQAKERIIELEGKQYKQNYCSSCKSVLRSKLKIVMKEGDE